ncbi:RHS repeat-associated core domain-containing protein [Glaesserella sp.]|uniref:RHS repeat-associated core domain-containing protein n=1 Tax=Glaesserella sp. TaxID=2094731 RepID=UPI0035A087CF
MTIQKPNQATEIWQYQYDVLGRRISKRCESHGNLQETRFIWDGSHLVQEENAQSKYSYIYTHPSSYEPLAQLAFAKNSANPTACYYYHNDQIGIPRELTDENGKLCWYGSYTGWGKLNESYNLTDQKAVHQPFRLQNQYADEETGLHYNFFRYYEPNVGRFTSLDPIGLAGGENLYRFGDNIQNWMDPLGLKAAASCLYQISKQELTCTRVENRETKTVSITKNDGVFSGRNEGTTKCQNNVSQACLNSKNYGPTLPGKYKMIRTDKFGGSWWLDEGFFTRIFRSRNSFYLHKGSVSWGCITVDKTNAQGMSKYSELEQILKDVDSPEMTVVK